MGPPWGGVGHFFLAENESHIYPNMCAKFGYGPTVVSMKGGYRHTAKGTLHVYMLTPTHIIKCPAELNFDCMILIMALPSTGVTE